MANYTELETERLILREITEQTFDYIFQELSEKDAMRFLGVTTAEGFQREKEKYDAGFTTFNKKICYFQMIDKADQTIIGWCGYHTWYIDHRRAEIGYELFDEAYRGKGLMTEAITPIIAYGFKTLDLHRIEAFVGPTNTASLNIMQKMNFTKEGHLRKHYFKNGTPEDSLVFSLLREEYDGLE